MGVSAYCCVKFRWKLKFAESLNMIDHMSTEQTELLLEDISVYNNSTKLLASACSLQRSATTKPSGTNKLGIPTNYPYISSFTNRANRASTRRHFSTNVSRSNFLFLTLNWLIVLQLSAYNNWICKSLCFSNSSFEAFFSCNSWIIVLYKFASVPSLAFSLFSR